MNSMEQKMTSPQGRTYTVQTFNDARATVTITKAPSGQRFAKIVYFGPLSHMGKAYVPVQMLSLCAGKDAWMQHIKFACADCKERHPAHEMECELCPVCFDRAGEENAIADGR